METGTGGSIDKQTVEGFGYEWTKFDQSEVDPAELEELFSRYFAVFPWDALPPDPVGLDLGCGSGRWALLAEKRSGTVVGVDASADALKVAAEHVPGCPLVQASAGALPIAGESLDFAYSLGVLHHIPDPLAGLTDAVAALKPGAPFLVYLYYAFDNRPPWFRRIWQASDLVRRGISRTPQRVRYALSQVLALVVYLPLARTARALERRGVDVEAMPLVSYKDRSFYAMRTDALDRFGTRLEKRFTKEQVVQLLRQAGLERVRVAEGPPYWCAVGFKPEVDGAGGPPAAGSRSR
ncbi:MAG: class I SAM-dependent methyltransferase [Actinomycetota bacterium]|nr:class I SAM-dependent methyltransferase [Actinomycetota bacterium]